MTRALVAILALVAACSGEKITGTSCTSDAECNLFATQGTCEPTGFCAYPDASCGGGLRYSPGAGNNLANTCVGGAPACGERDQVCCAANVCSANLTCATETGTCACGEAGQPCCEGTTCNGLACGPAAICSPNDVLHVAVGRGHICALRADHTVWCWGYDWKPYPKAVPGLSASVIASPTPVKIANLTDVVDIRASETHTCARKMDNTLWCWGHNETGQLGDGTASSSAAAVQVTGLSNVSMFDAGKLSTCAVGDVGGTHGVWCWGRGGEVGRKPGGMTDPAIGKLGNNTTNDSNVPVAVDLSAAAAAGQTVKALAVGAYHSCIAMSDNTVWCWGRNSAGQLGNNTTTSSKVPVKVVLTGITIPAGVTVTALACSDGPGFRAGSTCMLLSNGTMSCWGNNSGNFGDGSFTSHNAPATTATLPNGVKLVQLAVGTSATCAVDDAGAVWCAGSDKSGTLGLGLTGDGSVPVLTRTHVITGAMQVDVSHRTSCAVDNKNRLYCWGNNRRGQVTEHPPSPTEGGVLEPRQIAF